MVHSNVLYISGRRPGLPNVVGPGVAWQSYPDPATFGGPYSTFSTGLRHRCVCTLCKVILVLQLQ